MLELHGFQTTPRVLSEHTVQNLRAICGQVEDSVSRRNSTFAIRNLLDLPAIAELVHSAEVRALAEPILGAHFFAVRAIFFDKMPDANWKVPFHQDLSIAVKEKRETENFGPWSNKAGVIHVQPPIELLEKMLTVRLHLDACDQSNGALRFVSGSHLLGRLGAQQIEIERAQREEIVAEVEQGGALLMKPLVLHASSPAQTPAHRRVVHLELANFDLPNGLKWRWRI